MEEKCLAFFQERSKEPLELVHVKHKYNSLTFSIENEGDTCITLIIYDDLSVMKIDLLSRCSLQRFLDRVYSTTMFGVTF